MTETRRAIMGAGIVGIGLVAIFDGLWWAIPLFALSVDLWGGALRRVLIEAAAIMGSAWARVRVGYRTNRRMARLNAEAWLSRQTRRVKETLHVTR